MSTAYRLRPTERCTISQGDRFAACFGVTANGKFYSAEEQFGRSVVLILADGGALPTLSPALDAFVENIGVFTERDTDVMAVVNDNPAWLWPDGGPPLATIDCGDLLSRCGVGPREALIVVLDRNMRVAARFDVEAEADPVTACVRCLDDLPREAARDVVQPAPVIVLPNLLSRDFCRNLIALFESGATIEGTVSRIDEDGIARNVVDHGKKRRRDMHVEPDDPLHQTLETLLLSRCAPEIAKAFQVHITRIDRILISRYDDSGGWFRRHRDNAAANIAFREFAISVNLNSEDYAGGHLLFPEYNDHRYRPPTGGGLVFSAGLLHEAAPVASGVRYVLLTFFHSDAAETRRRAQTRRLLSVSGGSARTALAEQRAATSGEPIMA